MNTKTKTLHSTNKVAIIIAIALMVVGAIYWLVTPEKEVLPQMTVAEKKARFKKILVPAIDTVHAKLMKQYHDVSADIAANNNKTAIQALYKKYKVTTDEALLMALKPSPKSIALAQAAMESSWATSRFFLEARNVFGVWSFNKNEPRIAAGEQRGDKTIWIKKYDTVEESVADYYLTLARSHAFEGFRALKMKTDDPFELVKQLDRYSEKGALYGKELSGIIKFNKFTEYDK